MQGFVVHVTRFPSNSTGIPCAAVLLLLPEQEIRGGADSDILMKQSSECSEKPVLPGFSEENQALKPENPDLPGFSEEIRYSKQKIRFFGFIQNTDPTPKWTPCSKTQLLF